MDVTGSSGFQPHLHKATSGRQRWCAHLLEILNLYQDVELSGLRSWQTKCPLGLVDHSASYRQRATRRSKRARFRV